MTAHLSCNSRNAKVLPFMAVCSKPVLGLKMKTRKFGGKSRLVISFFFFFGQLWCILYICLNCALTSAPGATILLLSDSVPWLWKKQSSPFVKYVLLSSAFSRPGHRAHVFSCTLDQPSWSWSQCHCGYHGYLYRMLTPNGGLYIKPCTLALMAWKKVCFLKFCVRIPYLSTHASSGLCPKPRKGP